MTVMVVVVVVVVVAAVCPTTSPRRDVGCGRPRRTGDFEPQTGGRGRCSSGLLFSSLLLKSFNVPFPTGGRRPTSEGSAMEATHPGGALLQ